MPVVIRIGIAVVIARPAEPIATIGLMVVALTIAYQPLEAPALGLSVTVAVLSVFTAVLGSMSVWRTRLEEQLQIADTSLEERVRERTATLGREVEERARAQAVDDALLLVRAMLTADHDRLLVDVPAELSVAGEVAAASPGRTRERAAAGLGPLHSLRSPCNPRKSRGVPAKLCRRGGATWTRVTADARHSLADRRSTSL